MRLYLIAMQFLTIIPLPFDTRCRREDLGRSLAFFPLAGATIGALVAVADRLISPLMPVSLKDAILIAIISIITGALHLDGLADVSDAIASRAGRERFLEIMKDPRVGAAGASAIALDLLLKWQALVAIPEKSKCESLLVFLTLSRFGQVITVVAAEKAANEGLGASFISGAGKRELLVAGSITIAVCYAAFASKGILLFAAVAAMTLALKEWLRKKSGGITGDIIGCISEINETAVLILIAALHGSRF